MNCTFCFKHFEEPDYSKARYARIHNRMDFGFRESFKSRGGNLKRAEKEDTIELALPSAFSLDSEDSRIESEREAVLGYSKLGPTCVRFLGLHRIHSKLEPLKRDPPQNFAMVAIGTMSNPYPDVWTSSGALCEEHLQDNCVPLKGATDKGPADFRSGNDFQSFSCDFCHKKGMSSAAIPTPMSTNVHKQISKRATLKLMLFDERVPQDEHACPWLEQNYFFRWKCEKFSAPTKLTSPTATKSMLFTHHQQSFTQSDVEPNKDNWISLLEARFDRACNSSPDLKLYSSSVKQQVIEVLKLKFPPNESPPYLNPNFKDNLKSCIEEAIKRSPNLHPHWIALAGLHADILATDLAHSFHRHNQHFLQLDQLQAGSGFIECEAIHKQLLLDCSQAQIMVSKIPKLNATFTDQDGTQLLPAIEIIGISDSWLYAAGDPFLRCENCTCDEPNRTVITIHNKANQTKFYQEAMWLGLRVQAITGDAPYFTDQNPCHLLEFVPNSTKVRLSQQIPRDCKQFVLLFECPFHRLAGNLRVKFSTGDSDPKPEDKIMIMQALPGGDYAIPQALPSPNLFTILAMFSNNQNAYTPSSQQFWKFRIGKISRLPVPAFHHFVSNSPILTQPWKNADHKPRGNSYCVAPPQGNCILDCASNARKVGECYYYSDPSDKPPCLNVFPECTVCFPQCDQAAWNPARCNLVTEFIPLVDCVTDVGQSKWSLHFELDSNVSLPRQGGVMFVYMPANLGKTQKQRPEVLGFVGTSSPVLSIDIIERERSDKTFFTNGFPEIFESLLVSCMDGRIFVVNSPRVPVFELPEATTPNPPKILDQATIPNPPKSLDHFKSVDQLKKYIQNQLQDSSHQHALFNGCLIDYALKIDSGSPSLKSIVCPPSVFSNDDVKASKAFKCDNVVKYLQQSLSKSSAAQRTEFVSQDAAAAHKKTCLEQQLLRKVFLNMKVNSSKSVKQDAQSRLIDALLSEKDQIESKISKTFVDHLFEIYRLQQVTGILGPAPISPLNFLTFGHQITAQSNIHRDDFIEMRGVLKHVRQTVLQSLGYQNATFDLSRAELHFLQSIRDEFHSYPSPPVTSQMALELLTPVSGLKRLHAHAESVHYLGSFNGSFCILAEISDRTKRTAPETKVMMYNFRIPSLQRGARADADFLCDWLPQHSSFVEIKKVEIPHQTFGLQQTPGSQQVPGSAVKFVTVETKCPHGLRVGDFVRFRDPSHPLQNLQPFKVNRVNDLYSFQFDAITSGGSVAPPKQGSFVHVQPRFFPFQKLEQKSTLLSDAKSSVKCLIVSKSPRHSLRKAAWIETPDEKLCFWSGDATPTQHAIEKNIRVECSCFLPPVQGAQKSFIALGCSFQGSSGSPNRLYLYSEEKKNIVRLDRDTDLLPAITRLTPLPTDDAVIVDPNYSFILVAATKLTQFNESAFFLHVTVQSDSVAVKCFRSINEIKAAVSASRKPVTITPLRATHLTFTSIDVMPIRSKAHNIEDSWLYTYDLSTKYIAEVQGPNQPFDLRRIDNVLVEETRWQKDRRIQFLAFLKAEHHFIQFLRPDLAPPAAALALGLYDKIFTIEETKDTSFFVTAGSAQKISLPKGEYKFQVVVPSDVDGEHGHDSGIAKFAFLLDSPSGFETTKPDVQFRAKMRLFAVPLRSWFPKTVQGKFGNNLQ